VKGGLLIGNLRKEHALPKSLQDMRKKKIPYDREKGSKDLPDMGDEAVNK
jgi:hypothetical protein